MRIISGKYKGRRIQVHKNFKARPTTDFAKESVFDILANYYNFDEIIALDLFAGTGSISLEFASRGCMSVDLVESDFQSYRFINETIRKLDIAGINPYRGDVFQYIARCTRRYDLIFADPPYLHERIAELPDLIFGNKLLKPSGWFILEHSGKFNFTRHSHFRELRKYGSVHFSIFSQENSEDQ